MCGLIELLLHYSIIVIIQERLLIQIKRTTYYLDETLDYGMIAKMKRITI